MNQEFARELFHSEHAVGRYFKNEAGVSVQIVGIVADGKYLSLSEDQDDAAFFPIIAGCKHENIAGRPNPARLLRTRPRMRWQARFAK